MTATKFKLDYPDERPDWLMVDEYAKQKSIFGCILCDKTHRKEYCEHKAQRTVYHTQQPQQKKDDNYSWYD